MIRSLAASLLLLASLAALSQTSKPIVLGYVRGHDHLIQPGEIDTTKLTRIHYAFLYPTTGIISTAWPTDDANLRTLVGLKRDHPSLEVLVSVGGANNSRSFSELALTPQRRQRFVASCMAVLAKYRIDGIDIDWEYPSLPEDKASYTALFRDLREAFDRSERSSHHHVLLSTATNGKPFFVKATDLAAVSRYVDTVALMGYDDYGPHTTITGNHAPLFTDPADPTAYSDDRYIHDYLAVGVPASKIVLGVPFYGYGWRDISATNHGLFQPAVKGGAREMTYFELAHNELLPGSGYTRFWDKASAVPYLYNETTHVFITYEDAESIASKAKFVRERGLAGIMFWEYGGDPDHVLLGEIDKGLTLSHMSRP